MATRQMSKNNENKEKSTTTGTTSSKPVLETFSNDFVAFHKGETVDELAERCLAKNKSIILAQIAVKESETFALEDKVAVAKENLRKSTLNHGKMVENNDDYVSSMLDTKNQITIAEKALKAHAATINFLKERLNYLV